MFGINKGEVKSALDFWNEAIKRMAEVTCVQLSWFLKAVPHTKDSSHTALCSAQNCYISSTVQSCFLLFREKITLQKDQVYSLVTQVFDWIYNNMYRKSSN